MSNIFQKIINNEIPSYKIYEDDQFIAILDIFPKQNGHFLVIPKKYSKNLLDIDDKTLQNAIVLARKLALHVIKRLNISAFSVHINNGVNSKQVVMHTHIHIVPEKNHKNLSFQDMQKLLAFK